MKFFHNSNKSRLSFGAMCSSHISQASRTADGTSFIWYADDSSSELIDNGVPQPDDSKRLGVLQLPFGVRIL